MLFIFYHQYDWNILIDLIYHCKFHNKFIICKLLQHCTAIIVTLCNYMQTQLVFCVLLSVFLQRQTAFLREWCGCVHVGLWCHFCCTTARVSFTGHYRAWLRVCCWRTWLCRCLCIHLICLHSKSLHTSFKRYMLIFTSSICLNINFYLSVNKKTQWVII